MADHPRPIATVDVVVLALLDGALSVGLLRRDAPDEPAYGERALPGGFVRVGEDADLDAVMRRVLRTKVGAEPAYGEQLGTRGNARRDPRGWSLSVSYAAILSGPAPGLEFHDAENLPPLAFDHAEIVAQALDRLRAKASYSALPLFLIPEPFTLTEALTAYRLVAGGPIDAANFRRKLLAQDVLEKRGERRDIGRPTQLFGVRPGAELLFRRPLLS